MEKIKTIYSLIIIILYVPLVFLGANVFFPEYSGENSYYRYNECYKPTPVDNNQIIVNETAQQECQKQQEAKSQEFQKAKNKYESKKYIAITIFNLVILIITLFLVLDSNILLGLFVGSTIATFAATIRFFDTNSKIGFVILLLIFIITIYVINKYKDKFLK